MGWWQIGKSDVLSILVSIHSIISSNPTLISSLELRQIPMIITVHLQVKHLRLTRSSSRDEIRIKKIQDASTNISELGFNLASVVLNKTDMVVVLATFFLLLDGRDNAPSSSE
uniref:Uncharacterized protein n=1 Tax=Opuntia streptacantha TaxID=393608 RepID=A0A7C9AX63_OPUST